MQRYNPKDIEPKWQKIWEESGTYTADLNSNKPKYIAMSMFNYPSGAGIHIGHAMNYTISDVKARFKRQQGYESYHPVGWDAFGLPAENYAIKAGVSPQVSMATIIPSYHKQYKAMGWSNDWEKEIATHLPEYYKWTQWIFAQMYKHGLAYQDSRMQWWCAIDNTVLANEQVIDGKCWRHDGPDDPLVEKKEVKQWFFKITEYADELLEAIDDLDWTESVKLSQKNWIGKSVGAEISFQLQDPDQAITVFTTRPDTLFGATFMVVAPDSELAQSIVTEDQKTAVTEYIRQSAQKTEVERQASKEKTGVFSGTYAINPVTDEPIPVWIADYVLAGYGTGAIMAVPAHDERDHEFAKKFKLPVIPVVAPTFLKDEIGDVTNAVERPTAIGIGYDPKTDKYCVLNWHDTWREDEGYDWPGGGIDAGESLEAAAQREFTEETGYSDVTVEKILPAAVVTYFRLDDGQTKRAVKGLVRLRVNSLSQNAELGTEDYEKNSYTVHWLSQEEILANPQTPINRAISEFAFDETVHVGEGTMVNSGLYNGRPSNLVREKIVADLTEKGIGREKVNYKMRDWSVSRQRYWGAPIPIIDCPKCGPKLVPDEALPVLLPELDDFQPSGDGRSALARAKDWLTVECPQCGGPAERETDTLDTYIDSSWYMYRYFDPHNQQMIFDSNVAKKWEPIDFYNGADHATAHLLYARFMARFFKKLGLVSDPEPFKQFLFNGKVTAADGQMFSKSKGNGVDPLEIIDSGYGADALRTYLMFAAPLELWAKWDPQGVPGTYRFLNRLWTLVGEYNETTPATLTKTQDRDLRRVTHQTIKKVTEDLEANRYNTAIAASMACVNDLYKLKTDNFGKDEAWQQALESTVACVAPFAPHLAEDLWHQLGHSLSVHVDTWPMYDEKYLVQDTMIIAVQINGKLRGEVTVPSDADEATVVTAAQANDKVKTYIEDKDIRKTIYVPGKLVSFVV
jgi:leucyl-tRNA synthetase